MENLQEVIFPYLLKEYLINLIIFLSIMVLALFLFLLIHKAFTEKRNRDKNGFIAEYRNMLTRYLNDGSPLPHKPESALQFEAFADVCIGMLANVSFRAADSIKHLLMETGTVGHFRKKSISSRAWAKRFCAIEALGFFMIDDQRDFIKAVVNKDRSPEVRTKALWAWSLVAQEGDVEEIVWLLETEISNSSKFNVLILKNVIDSYRKRGRENDILDFLRRRKDDATLQSVIKRDLIEACGASGLKASGGLIDDFFYSFHSDTLMKIACIRALGALGCLNSRTTMLALTDADWRVRAVAAKAAHVMDAVVLKRLRRLLYDFVYIVRINSAKKLAWAGADGIAVLEKEMNSGDMFVRDTVRFILETARKEKTCLKT